MAKDEVQRSLGDVAAALEAGRELADVVHMDDDYLYVRARDISGAERVERVALDRDRPLRKAGTVALHEIKSLIAYVKRHADADTVVYADQTAEVITGVLDDHGVEPGHRAHRAVYACPRTPEWQAWKGLLNKKVGQEALVEFLEERALDVAGPPAAELQEMLRELSIKQDVTWKKSFDDRTGKVTLEYREDVTESADRAGSIQLFKHFTIGVPIFMGGEPYRCEVRLRFRLNDAKLFFVVSIDNVERIEEVAFGEAVKELEAGLGDMLVLRGTAPKVAP